MLTIEEINKFIQDDASSDKKTFARKGQAYYDGDNDIRQGGIFPARSKVLKTRDPAETVPAEAP